MFKTILCTLFFVLPLLSFAQTGCTDPQASNYDAAATENDGSCLYATTNYALTSVAIMPDLLEETSGLTFFDNTLWTHTDAAGEDKLYRIDTLTAEVTKEVIIATADNHDWEELAQSDTHVFIGDFGNNDGDRTDLRIFKVKKSDLNNETVVNADVINFSYADQTDFTPMNNANNFDCEAFFWLNGELHLFTKNWVDFQSRHYILPDVPGNYEAEPVNEFAANCLVTGASVDEEGTIALLGYTVAGSNIMWLFFDYPADDVLGGNKRRINLGSAINNSQTEGIVFSGRGRGFISAEEFSALPPRLLKFTTSQWTDNVTSSADNGLQTVDFQISPNPAGDFLLLKTQHSPEKIEILNAQGFPVFFRPHPPAESRISTNYLPSGFYFVKVYGKEGYGLQKIIIN